MTRLCDKVRLMSPALLVTMRELSPLSVDVSELLDRPGATKRFRFEAEIEGAGSTLARPTPGTAWSLDLRLDAIVEGIHVSGAVAGDVTCECRRCLASFHRRLEVAPDEVFAYPGAAVAEDEEYRVQGEWLDLEPMVRDAIVLALPLNPLCREDCKGLCAACGEDRNAVDCGHRGERVDLRWEPLRRLGGAGSDGTQAS